MKNEMEMNEAETRVELIDKQLEAAGWKTDIESGVIVHREYIISKGEIKASGLPTGVAGPRNPDYVLEYNNVKLAAIEAKSIKKNVREGIAQAKIYAQKLCLQTSFSANGKEIYEINRATNEEGKISKFPSPQELWQRKFGEADKWVESFGTVPFEILGGEKKPRYYQENAVNLALEAIAKGEKRVLLTLATGTGKTDIAFHITWKLFKSRWTQQKDGKRQPRMLFLTHRNILADQAIKAFRELYKDACIRINPADIAKRGEVPKNANIFFTIFQTFVSGEGEKKHFGEYEHDFFDLVIIDECHQGGANDESTWREVLNHFNSAVHLGLTATPKRKDNVDTYKYFGKPVFTYSLKEGISDGYLTPYRIKRIQSNIDEYSYSLGDEVLEGELKKGHRYGEPEFNRVGGIEIEEREQKRVKDMLANINEDEKTIVFCKDQDHAAMIRDMINQQAKKGDDYCVRVTSNDGTMGETFLTQFQHNQKTIPTILTTSRKLSTGVDARNVRNIVLLRTVKSMIEFKQIIGRGTRLFDGKYFFTIIDFVGAYHLFNDPEWDGKPAEIEDINDNKKTKGKRKKINTDDDKQPKIKTRIKLSDGKTRELQSMVSTYFPVQNKHLSVKEFVEYLFDTIKLPKLLGSEKELRKLWANPMTRKNLLEKLENAGCKKEDLEKLQELITPKDSDLFDVLEYIAYATPPVTRSARVEASKDNIYNFIDEKQKEFIDYILKNYIKEGVDELDVSKLADALKTKYRSIHDAQQKLGTIEEIQNTFVGFQKHLYQEANVA